MWTVVVTKHQLSGEFLTSERRYYDVRDALTVADIERRNAIHLPVAEGDENVGCAEIPDPDRLNYCIQYHGHTATDSVIVYVVNGEHQRITLREPDEQ